MMMRMLTAAGVVGLVSSTALASDIMFSEVDVTAELTAIEDPQAAEFWNTLESDLESRLLALLTDNLVEDGARLVVDIFEFSTGDMAMPFVLEEAALGGRVHVIDESNNANFDSYELKVRIEGMTATVEGTPTAVSQLSPEDAYERLVSAFADSIVQRLD